MEELLICLAKNLVNQPEAVSVAVSTKEDGTTLYELRVAEGEMGRVIGRQGRIAKAIRSVMKAAAAKTGERIQVDIVG
ncbi:MAG: KH domain-containing protein [Clostridiales bacterium]|nr:KH domain-containing protein [Clostridiales bacterium]